MFESQSFITHDGIILKYIFFKSELKNETPKGLIIFISSWGMNEYEYLVQVDKYSKLGYDVLSYTVRGFHDSGGLINVAGPNDVADLLEIICSFNANNKYNQLILCGISLGGGLSILTPIYPKHKFEKKKQERYLKAQKSITHVICMSCWGDVSEDLYPSQTINRVWIWFLIISGYLSGKMDKKIIKMMFNLYTNRNIDEVYDWLAERSPTTYLTEEKHNFNLYIIKNESDFLFRNNSIFKFFNDIKVENKIFEISQGTHGSSEIIGLLNPFDNQNIIKVSKKFLMWDRVSNFIKNPTSQIRFYDHGITEEYEIANELDEIFEEKYYDLELMNTNNCMSKFLPKEFFITGYANEISPNEIIEKTKINYNIKSWLPTLASTGIPIISPMLKSYFNIEVNATMMNDKLLIPKLFSISYISSFFPQLLKIRGIPRINLKIKKTCKILLVIYLYEVKKNGEYDLISHGVYSENKNDNRENISIDLMYTVHDIQKFSQFKIIIDTMDPLYTNPSYMPWSVDIVNDNFNNLILPAVS